GGRIRCRCQDRRRDALLRALRAVGANVFSADEITPRCPRRPPAKCILQREMRSLTGRGGSDAFPCASGTTSFWSGRPSGGRQPIGEEEPMIPRVMRKLILAAAALTFGGGLATAQDYPNRPIKVIVPFGAGGGTDIATRMWAELA